MKESSLEQNINTKCFKDCDQRQAVRLTVLVTMREFFKP